MKFEKSISISAEPSIVFSEYKKVSDWHKWDPETEAASIEGETSL